MYDTYESVVTENDSFIAAYKHCRIWKSGVDKNDYFLYPTLRILRVIEGNAKWQIGDRVISISPGDIVAVNNVVIRKFVHIEKYFDSEVFAFTPMVFGRETDCLRLFYDNAQNTGPLIDRNLPCFGNVNTLLDMAGSVFTDGHIQPRPIITSLITAAVSMILADTDRCRHSGERTYIERKHSAVVVSEAVKLIYSSLNEEFNVEKLAGQLNLSRGYFTRIFRAYTGITPGEFIKRCRVQNTIYLLNSGCTVTEAAMGSGFGSLSGFYKAFTSVCGTPPGKYLKMKTDVKLSDI